MTLAGYVPIVLDRETMKQAYRLRRQHAAAKHAYEEEPNAENAAKLFDLQERRARAIRMVAEESGMYITALAGVFKCSKTVVRAALAGGEGDD